MRTWLYLYKVYKTTDVVTRVVHLVSATSGLTRPWKSLESFNQQLNARLLHSHFITHQSMTRALSTRIGAFEAKYTGSGAQSHTATARVVVMKAWPCLALEIMQLVSAHGSVWVLASERGSLRQTRFA